MTRKSLSISLLLLVASAIALAAPQENASPGWLTRDLPFRVLNITSTGSALWACGTNESVAVSTDGGVHWQVRHQVADGGLLLTIGFANERFGYAAGTGGLVLVTENAGDTWSQKTAGNATVLQISFSDVNHGLIRTSSSLMFTGDGGVNWSAVSAEERPDVLKTNPFPFSLVALDSNHIAAMLKSGAAQYESQTFLITQDSGKSWHVIDIPNTTLYSFLRVGDKYWTVGIEVIHKEQKGGGYAVPVALYSSDGEKWTHSTSDLSACGPEMCVACTAQGCLSANGSIANIFLEKTSYGAFPSNQKLTAKWASSASGVCFVGGQLPCAGLNTVALPARGDGPGPVATVPGPLGTTATQGPHCIACALDQFMVDQKVQGLFTIKLTLHIGRNGTVTSVQTDGTPAPEIKSRIEQQAQQWIFEPYLKDGKPSNVELNTLIHVNVIKSR
jgi:hypothetical protein